MFIKQQIVLGVRLYLMIYSVLLLCGSGVRRGGLEWRRSGEWPLRYVLFCQVVVQVSSQSTDSDRCHVTGAAVCQTRQEKERREEEMKGEQNQILCVKMAAKRQRSC